MHSYLITGLRMGPLFRLLRKHGFTPAPKNLIRLAFVLHNAFWASFFAWRERREFRDQLARWPLPHDPVIIIGHWRTGSTLLHLLLSKDPQFLTPTVFQTAFPEGFLVSEKYFRPVMGRMLRRRPMDNVRLAFDDPQEDEFVVIKLTQDSPLLDFVFPEGAGYFILKPDDFNPRPGRREMWKARMSEFYRKVVRGRDGILLLKNPAHSLRIPLLLEMFPGARFIHIHRHPYQVIPSSIHLWNVMAKDNRLKGPKKNPAIEDVTDGLSRFYEVIEGDLATVPGSRKCDVSYEALEKDPIREIQRVYKALGLEYSREFDRGINSFLSAEKDFRKNSYTFGMKDRELVFERMKEVFGRSHYTR